MDSRHIIIALFINILLIKNINAQGVQTFQSIRLYHPTTQGQYISLLPPNGITSYGLTLPATQGAANTLILNDGSGNLSWNNGNGLFWGLTGNAGTVENTNFIGTTDNVGLRFRTNNTARMTIMNSGNVGIGTTTPSYLLSLSGQSSQTVGLERNTTAATAGQNLTLLAGGAFATGTNLAGGNLVLSSGQSTGTGTSVINFQTATAGASGTTDNTPSTKMTILGDGNVGIGNTNPTLRFDVTQTSNAGVIRGTGANSSTILGTNPVLTLNNTNNAINTTTGLVFQHNNASSVTRSIGSIDAFLQNATSGSEQGVLRFGVGSGATLTERMRINYLGNLGLGTTSPSYGLHVEKDNAAFINTTVATQGYFLLGNTNNLPQELRFQEADGSGANYSAFKAKIQSSDIIYTLPCDPPVVNEVLTASTISGAGPYYVDLDWITPSGGGGGTVTGAGALGQAAFWSTSSNLSGNNNFFWDNSNFSLGIRTAAPENALDVWGNVLIGNGSTTSSELRFGEPNYVIGTGNYTAFKAAAQSVNLTYTLPTAAATSSTNGSNRFAMISTASASPNLTWETVWSPSGNAGVSAGFLGTTDAQPLAIRTNNTERMRILSTGNIGIGTTSPSYRLDVNGNVAGGNPIRLQGLLAGATTDSLLTSSSGIVRRLDIANAVANAGWSKAGNSGTSPASNFIGTTDAQDLVFKTNNTEKLRVQSGGNVGIGVISPSAKLEIDGAVAFKSSSTAVISDNQVITVGNRSFLKISANDIPSNRTISLSNGLTEGQILYISVTATSGNGVELPDSGNVNLTAAANLENGDTLQLIWDGTVWNEITRSNN